MPKTTLPFFARVTITLLGLILLTVILWYSREILVPLAFAALLATLLNPVLNALERMKIPRLLAISLTVLLAILIVFGLAYFIAVQFSQFSEALPQFKAKLLSLVADFQAWLESRFRISTAKQVAYLRQGTSNLLQNSGALLSTTFGLVTGLVVLITLIPVYVFLLLLYRNLLVYFILQVFSNYNTHKVSTILDEIKKVIQSYIFGLLIEAAIVAALNSIALLLLGIDYAILLGVLGAVLNMIPYLGGLVAIALPVLIAMATKESLFYPLAVIGAYMFIQFIDNNILVPKVVASKVRINALISILAVLVGGALWGIAGMFLSIPLVAILKIIFDRIAPLKPWGMLLGDDIPDAALLHASSQTDSGIIILDKAPEE
ncbi:AI-2E family transporter [Adhaeribacter soli]|uniref:AI-2E family transporter n=1 Tax=Adhaeribacter soli TaxID=2607655 RepID=A0A5N1J958_9BACT|nr:AI-2E family transporter [Adhaeribacter soli]KAA9345845.1 AI-2E family transporter [Adhaeribacter soli]